MWFDESRLDDEAALSTAELRLRGLAESGSRVRRETAAAADAIEEAVGRAAGGGRPRAVIAAGPDSRLLRAVLEPVCPVPFVAWPSPGLPGWAGSLDLVVVLAPGGSDVGTASAVAEANRRGCQVIVAAPPGSLVADHAEGRYATLVPVTTTDPLAIAVAVLTLLGRVSLGPETEAEEIATALDEVAISCGPRRDLAVNQAKGLAISLADATPLVWGGSMLAARAARRVAESIRRASGRTALAGDAEHLLPVLEGARARSVFDDPVADGVGAPRPLLVLLDDGATEEHVVAPRRLLTTAADERRIRVELLAAEAPSDVARYGSLLLQGTYAAEYLRLGLVED